jgi:hypothetical protein
VANEKVSNPFEVEEPRSDEQALILGIELEHKIMIVMALFMYHVGLMLFEYGAQRKKHAELPLFRYPFILMFSFIFTWLVGFGIAHGNAHMLGVKYFLLNGVFDYKMELADHPEGIIGDKVNDFKEISNMDHTYSIQIPGGK